MFLLFLVYFNLLDIDQNVDSVKIKISSYIPLTVEKVKIWGLGYDGKVVFEDGNIIMTTNNLKSYDKMVFLGRFENNMFNTTNNINKSFDDIYDEALELKKYDFNLFFDFIKIYGEFFLFIIIGFFCILFMLPRGFNKSKDIVKYEYSKTLPNIMLIIIVIFLVIKIFYLFII